MVYSSRSILPWMTGCRSVFGGSGQRPSATRTCSRSSVARCCHSSRDLKCGWNAVGWSTSWASYRRSSSGLRELEKIRSGSSARDGDGRRTTESTEDTEHTERKERRKARRTELLRLSFRCFSSLCALCVLCALCGSVFCSNMLKALRLAWDDRWGLGCPPARANQGRRYVEDSAGPVRRTLAGPGSPAHHRGAVGTDQVRVLHLAAPLAQPVQVLPAAALRREDRQGSRHPPAGQYPFPLAADGRRSLLDRRRVPTPEHRPHHVTGPRGAGARGVRGRRRARHSKR